MRVFTIGFTRKSAERFFTLIKDAGVKTVVDIRLNNSSQLAGFAQGRDLPYFLAELTGAAYVHMPDLAPSKDLLAGYRQDQDWGRYETEFEKLLDAPEAHDARRQILDLPDPICLLCSEDEPDQCHRRLVAERLQRECEDIQISHLV